MTRLSALSCAGRDAYRWAMRFWCVLTLTCLVAWPLRAEVSVISCLLEPSRHITLSPAAEGLIVDLPVGLGQHVIEGQVLALLDTSVEQASLAAARFRAESDAAILARQAQLEEAGRLLAQTQSLVDRGVASQNALAELFAEQKIAEGLLKEAEDARAGALLEVKVAEAALEQRRVRAPSDGVILERLQDEGEYASPDLPMMTLVNVNPLHVDMLLPEEAYNLITLATDLRVESGGTTRPAKITSVDPLIDAASRTFAVRAELDNADAAFIAGLRCTAYFGLQD